MTNTNHPTTQKDEISKLNQICFWLIDKCIQTEADFMKITQKNVNFEGVELGDWEIIIKRKDTKPNE